MGGWTQHHGQALVLAQDNIDTDQLIPARFMSTPRNEGYGDFLLHDLRRDADGTLAPDFPLNRHKEASILIAGRNFGSGSSREAAVYALLDAGIRAVLAPSFGDIFTNNAVNNGLLPARISQNDASRFAEKLGSGLAEMRVSLTDMEVRLGNLSIPFEIGETLRNKLINGWDDIDLTLAHADAIDTFEQNRKSRFGWAFITR